MARYPEIRVSVRSSNPLALVAAVRQELRRAGVAKEEIARFSDEAFSGLRSGSLHTICRHWVGSVADELN